MIATRVECLGTVSVHSILIECGIWRGKIKLSNNCRLVVFIPAPSITQFLADKLSGKKDIIILGEFCGHQPKPRRSCSTGVN